MYSVGMYPDGGGFGMTYCIEWFHKFKKEGNFCDLDKSEVSRINGYLEIVDLLTKAEGA